MVHVADTKDPPREFHLLTPENGATISHYPDSPSNTSYTWEVALQNEHERDEVHYTVYFTTPSREFEYVTDEVDSPKLMNLSNQLINDELSLNLEKEVEIIWWVLAEDDSGLTVESMNEYSLNIPALSVGDNMDNNTLTTFLYPVDSPIHLIHQLILNLI